MIDIEGVQEVSDSLSAVETMDWMFMNILLFGEGFMIIIREI